MKTALLSVSDKTGIVAFAQTLHSQGFTILSTGGTAKALREAGVAVTPVSDVTNFPEILDGRVKTLHPKIHGGLLAQPNNASHLAQMEQHGISKIDLVVVNLYPFEQTLASNATFENCIENIDIGGPAMVRASAKNFEHTVVLTNPSDYDAIAEFITTSQPISFDVRLELARKAFAHTAAYDARISNWLATITNTGFPAEGAMPLRLAQHLRYGENPHQQAALYGSFTTLFHQIHGKELSYNNILDINAAAQLALEFTRPTTVIVKHTNPCGVGSGVSLLDAWHKAFATDTVSPFGGIVAFTHHVDDDLAELIHPIFTEVLIAPSFSQGALEILQKKRDRRLMTVDYDALRTAGSVDVRSVAGGVLMQSADSALLDEQNLSVVTVQQPTDEQREAMMFAWKVAKHVKSNAIVYATADRTLAIGAGQMSRVDSARIAVRKAADAGLDLNGCAVASDAFFPFADGLLQAAQAGATCVIQPGGSIRDAEVIQAADEHGLTMMFTNMRHFKH